MPSELNQLERDPDVNAAVLRARQAAIPGLCKEAVMAMGGRARMVMAVPHDHVVAVVVRRMVIVVRRIRMIVGLAVVVLCLQGPRRDESDRHNGRRYYELIAHGFSLSFK
jgi:hypothetical protein